MANSLLQYTSGQCTDSEGNTYLEYTDSEGNKCIQCTDSEGYTGTYIIPDYLLKTGIENELPFSGLEDQGYIPDRVIDSEAERCLAFYEKKKGLSAFKENGLGVRIAQVCEFLIEEAGFELIHTEQILIPDSERYAVYRDTDQTLWGCTNYTTKEVHLLGLDEKNLIQKLTHNFAFIHETGHVLRGADESEANLFARYLSLPKSIFKKRFIELTKLHYDSRIHKESSKYIFCELVGDFQISGRTCLLRALDLGLIIESTRKLLWHETILPRRG